MFYVTENKSNEKDIVLSLLLSFILPLYILFFFILNLNLYIKKLLDIINYVLYSLLFVINFDIFILNVYIK